MAHLKVKVIYIYIRSRTYNVIYDMTTDGAPEGHVPYSKHK